MILTPFAECAAPKSKARWMHCRCWTLFNSYDFGQRFFSQKCWRPWWLYRAFGGRNRIRVPRQGVPVGRTKKADAYLSYSLIVRTCNGVATKYGYVQKRQIFPNQSHKRKLSVFPTSSRRLAMICLKFADILHIKGYVKIFSDDNENSRYSNLTSVGE